MCVSVCYVYVWERYCVWVCGCKCVFVCEREWDILCVCVKAWKEDKQPLAKMRRPVKIQAHWSSPHFVLVWSDTKEWKIERKSDSFDAPLSSHPLTAVIPKKRNEKGLIFALDLTTMGYRCLPENPSLFIGRCCQKRRRLSFPPFGFLLSKKFDLWLWPMKPDL